MANAQIREARTFFFKRAPCNISRKDLRITCTIEPYKRIKRKGVSAQNVELEDQLERAAAGSWQIADGGDLRTARAQVTSVGDFRVHFAVEL